MTRTMTARAGAPVALALFAITSLVGCGGDDTTADTSSDAAPAVTEPAATDDSTADTVADGSDDTAVAATDPAITEAPEETVAPAGTGDGSAFEITAEAAGGEPVGGVRSYLVEVGQTVSITVTSDTADEAHLHGYDLDADLEPGVPATITFTADTAGSFEMELHESGALLFYLDVV